MNSTSDSPARSIAQPAPLGWRLISLTYDCLPMIPLLMVTSAIFLWLNGGRTVEHQPLLAGLELLVIWVFVGTYFVLSWRRGGQTVGMRPWRLKVLAADGQPASVRALCLRYVVGWATPVFGLLWALVDAEHRTLYDLASGTVFVRLQATPPA